MAKSKVFLETTHRVGLAVLLLSPTLSWATTDDLMTEDDLFTELTSVTAATRLEQNINESPAAVTVLDRWIIEASGAVNIADLLKLVPGFQSYQVHANKFGVTSHGQSDDHPGRLEVTIDGRSVYLPALSSVDWSMLGISLNDIDHIEVVRGPSVATHGSNAFLGAIHITTRSPLQDSASGIQLTAGALETRDLSLRQNGQVGPLSYRLNVNYHHNDGNEFGFLKETTDRVEMPDGAEISQFNVTGLYTPNLQDTLSAQIGFGDGWIGVGNGNDPTSFNRREGQNNYQNLIWTRQLADGDALKIQGYRNHQNYENHKYILASDYASQLYNMTIPPSAMPGIINAPDQLLDLGQETGTTDRLDLELQYTGHVKQLRLLGGVGIRQDKVQGSAVLGHDDTLSETYYRAFGNIEWRPGASVVTNLGAMYERNGEIGGRLSPRLGVNWNITPGHTVRAASALAYRTPSILEQNHYAALLVPSTGESVYIDFYTPVQLEPEQIRSHELGYMIQAPSIKSIFDAKLFIEHIDSAIADRWATAAQVSEPVIIPGPVLQARNTAHWKSKGAELQWRLQPQPGTELFMTYAYADVTGEHNRRQSDGGAHVNQLDDRTPKHQLNLLGSQLLGSGYEASLGFYRQTSITWHKGDELKPYNRVDGRLAKRFGNQKVEAVVELILQSFTAPYTEFERNSSVDNRGFVRLRLDFL